MNKIPDILTEEGTANLLGLYVLDENKNIRPAKDVLEWSKFFESENRIVQQTWVDGYHISTVFIGINYSGESGLFETMVFNPSGKDIRQVRSNTWDEALATHNANIDIQDWRADDGPEDDPRLDR